MTKDKALKLALDALERSVATCLDPYSHEQVRSRPEHFINQAITALRLVIDVQNMASKSTYKEQLETKELAIEKTVEEANYIIFKSCINQSHWKRSAMRYLKRNAPMLHHQAVTDYNEHPDGRGQE